MFKHFEMHLSVRAVADGLFHIFFSVCVFKLRFEFVHSDAGVCEGDFGSVLLYVRRGSLCAH